MKNSTHSKSIVREILSSKARFASILVIIFLGVAFYSGIKSSGPDMEATINEFYSNQKLMDSKIVSSLGLTKNDLMLLAEDESILEYEAAQSLDVNLTNKNSVVKFMSYNPRSISGINQLVIVEGRLPQKPGEIVLDEKALQFDKELKIGGLYNIESDEDTMEMFNRTAYEIVGFAKHPMYIDKDSRGSTTIGKGSIDYFAVVNESDIAMDVYTEVYVRFKNVEGVAPYSQAYKEKMEENNKHLKTLFSGRTKARIEEVKAEAKIEIDKGYKEIEDGEGELAKGEKDIAESKLELAKAHKDYEQGLLDYEKGIKDGEAQLAEGESQLVQGRNELTTQKQQFETGEKQLQEAKVQLDQAKEELLAEGIDPDNDLSTYQEQIKNLDRLINTYDELAKDIRNIAGQTSQGSAIPSEKIQYWKGMILDASLGLSELNGLIDQLAKAPTQIDLAINIARNIDVIKLGNEENRAQLQNVVEGIIQYHNGLTRYKEELKTFNDGKVQISQAERELDQAKSELEQGRRELEKGKIEGKVELEKARVQLEDAKIQLADGEKEIQDNKQKLVEAREEIENEKAKLNDLDSSKYYFFDRTDNPGYSTYGDSIQSLDNIASVFPVFFFLVAILICLTTMTRMVEEKRGEIGTLKALGYTNLEIAKKFVVYSALASIIGAILGILVGSSALPYIINSAYASMFDTPELKIHYYTSYIVQSMILSILCTVGASVFVLMEELRDHPSNLMRPKAPKLGKKIFLERITPLWRRLNFNQKVTFRNLFRYKQRMIMTVLGIAGCMAMLVTGFSLKKSNSESMDKQFTQMIQYDAMVVFDEDATAQEEQVYEETLEQLEGYESGLDIHQESITFKKEGMNKQTVMLYVPKEVEVLNNYMTLRDRKTQATYQLSNDGAIINEKLAKLLGVSKGDVITFQDSDANTYEVRVDAITENYYGHNLYLSPEYYEEVFNKAITYNAQLLKFNLEQNEDSVQSILMDTDKVINVTLVSALENSSMDSSLDIVMLVLIVSSGCLAFVVLYNLININVSERIRELSTIKVLGFFDNEVTMYIFRENIILTLLGILVGSVMGKVLFSFILMTAETDTMMMVPDIYMGSYIISGCMTLMFAFLVMLMMHIKLKHIDMIDALKSVE